jgi:hypothetical protein
MGKDLSRLSAGLYVDEQGTLIVRMQEFLSAHGIADSPDARAAVLAEIRRQFGDVALREEP